MLQLSFDIFNLQLENKVASLEEQLAQTLDEKQRLREEFHVFKIHSQKLQSSNKYSDQTATIEQLSEVCFDWMFKNVYKVF